MADIGLQQVQRDGSVEPGMVTTGDELSVILRFLSASGNTYSAATAVKTLMSHLPAQKQAAPAEEYAPYIPAQAGISHS
jgi:hypothetical protein